MLESFRIITNNPAVVEKNYAENEYYDVALLYCSFMQIGNFIKMDVNLNAKMRNI